MGAFTKLFSRLRITSDPNVSTQTSAVIRADTTNANLVIAPNGTGALIASIPDGTATGGNARGNNAVDLQMARSNAAQVVSGSYSMILAGASNKVTKDYSISGGINCSNEGRASILFGNNNTIALNCDNAGILCGNANTLNSGDSAILSGRTNTLTSAYGVIAGGQGNTGSTSSHVTIVGGQSNVSSGQHSVSGGNGNAASGTKSIALGGSNNAQAESSVTLGQQNVTTQPYSFSSGYFASSYLYGQKSHQNGRFDLAGDAQVSQLVARKSDTLLTAATTVLSLDGTGTTNLIIPTGVNRMWNVTIKFVAVVTTITGTATGVTVGDTKSQNIEIGFKKVGGVSSLLGGGVFSTAQQDASMASASLVPTAGASQELALTFTAPTFAGGGSVTCRVVAKVELVEVAY